MVFSRDIGGGSSSEMAIPARQGVSRGSNCTSAHQWFTRDTPEKSVELGYVESISHVAVGNILKKGAS